MLKGLFALTLASCCISFSSSSCPSNEYVYCASEGNSCDIPSNIDQGYISYGVNSRYTLVPFSNSAGSTLTIRCDNDFGDIYDGSTKYCCYIDAENGFDQTTFYDIIWEGSDWDFGAGRWSMYYGANGQYLYRVISGATGYCTNSFFNDVVYGIRKHCRKTWRNPPVLDSTTWINCANEGNDCTGLDTSAHWIRYGEDSDFYYRLVVTGDGRVPCNNRFFEDPKSGTRKFCWRSEAQYSFSGGVGYWSRIPSCGGCSSNEYTKTIGIEELTESEMSNSWELSLTTTLSSDYTFGSVELSVTVATSVTNTLTTALTTTTTLETKYICEKNSVYQWITDVTQSNGITTTDFTISSEDFWCIDSGLVPQCAPGYCLDDNCQQCNYP